jgi:hypothetical protein
MAKKSHNAIERLVFGRTGWAIDFHGCEEILRGVKRVFRGWNLKSGPQSKFPDAVPRALISRTTLGWHWHEMGAPKARDWDAIPPRTPMRVITDVHDAAIYWYLADNPGLLCLHGAAVKIGRGLVCFPARGRSGKSTLAACLAASGHKVFADDVLGLDGVMGRGLGFLPRLRVPLAPKLTRRTASYIASHQGPADTSWIYLDPGGGKIAKLGETCGISAFVLLERADEGPSRIGPARTVDVLKHLIAENIIRQLPMPVIFDRLHELATTKENLVLRYSNPQDAARKLEERFA